MSAPDPARVAGPPSTVANTPVSASLIARAALWLAILVALTGALATPAAMRPLVAAPDASPIPFQLAASGCPMAHCDPQMSDLIRKRAPAAAVLQWHDPVEATDGTPFGSPGLGCASNGSTVACSFGEVPEGYPGPAVCNPAFTDTIIAYDYAGPDGLPQRRWGSGDLLNCTAFTSAPIIGADGSVIAADNRTVIRFDNAGNVIWQTATPGGYPLSPVITANGIIVLATSQGPVSAYDSETGALIGVLDFPDGDGRYETVNTPGVRGNRVYVLAHHSERRDWGRLIAIDVTLPDNLDPLEAWSASPQQSLVAAWSLDVGGEGGASPLVVGDMIYFDGDRLEPGGPLGPHVFAVHDMGNSGEIVWVKPVPGRIRASFALDPRGGFWVYTHDEPARPVNRFLFRMAFKDRNGDGQGDIIDLLDVDALVGEPGIHRPFSAISIAGDRWSPWMLLSATPLDAGQPAQQTFVVAIALRQRQLVWKVPLPVREAPAQFPIAEGEAGPRLFFTSSGEGTWMIGEP